MNITSFLRDKLMLYLLHLVCMMALGVFLLATGYPKDACLLIWICWILVLLVWTITNIGKENNIFPNGSSARAD